MSEENPRLGQVWSCGDSIEMIVKWYDIDRRVHRTLILNYDARTHGYNKDMFDHVKEETLSNSESLGGLATNWKRIA